jgi:hypothetical protein
MTSSGLSDPTEIVELDQFWIGSGIPAARRRAAVEIDLRSYAALWRATREGEMEKEVEEAHRGGEKSHARAKYVLSSFQGASLYRWMRGHPYLSTKATPRAAKGRVGADKGSLGLAVSLAGWTLWAPFGPPTKP